MSTNFPLPNSRQSAGAWGEVTIVASTYLHDDEPSIHQPNGYTTALTLCLLPESPYFLVCVFNITDPDYPPLFDYTCGTEYNIVPAVALYELNGGDY